MVDTLTILTSVTASGAFSAAIVWLAKSWISERLKTSIKHEYDQKLASFHAQLKAKQETELEKLRAELQIAASERQIRYQKLHEQVAKTVANTYGLLQQMYGLTSKYVSDLGFSTDPSDEELVPMIEKAISKFRRYYRPRRIYFPKEVAEQIDEFDGKLFSLARRHSRMRGTEGKIPDDKWIKKADDISDMMEKEMPAVFEQLENQFRYLLGSKTDAK